jgi:hypothetical protein
MPLVSARKRRAIGVLMFVGDMIWFLGSAANKVCTKRLQVCSGRSVAAGAPCETCIQSGDLGEQPV